MQPNRAWRFRHPDLDTGGEGAGLQVTARGSVAMVEGDDSIRQAVLLLLSTMPGERVMRPDYGCDLQRLLFMPNDDTAAGLAIHYVQRALDRWEPRIEGVHVDAGASLERPAVLDIQVEYRVRATQRVEQMTFSVDLSGEGD